MSPKDVERVTERVTTRTNRVTKRVEVFISRGGEVKPKA